MQDQQIPCEKSVGSCKILKSTPNTQPKFINYITKASQRQSTRAWGRHNTKKKSEQLYFTLDNFRFTNKFIQVDFREKEIEKVVFVGGTKISGTWKYGKLNGICKFQYETGEQFTGKYEYGIRIQGILKFKDGSQYQGKFNEGCFHGPGIITDPSNRRISCHWNRGVAGKNGRILYPSGDVFVGQLENMKKQGKGALFFSNGDKFLGNFKNGYIHGYGKYYSDGQKILEGCWDVGSLKIDENMEVILKNTLCRFMDPFKKTQNVEQKEQSQQRDAEKEESSQRSDENV